MCQTSEPLSRRRIMEPASFPLTDCLIGRAQLYPFPNNAPLPPPLGAG